MLNIKQSEIRLIASRWIIKNVPSKLSANVYFAAYYLDQNHYKRVDTRIARVNEPIQ
jgi:hypothetical protein